MLLPLVLLLAEFRLPVVGVCISIPMGNILFLLTVGINDSVKDQVDGEIQS